MWYMISPVDKNQIIFMSPKHYPEFYNEKHIPDMKRYWQTQKGQQMKDLKFLCMKKIKGRNVTEELRWSLWHDVLALSYVYPGDLYCTIFTDKTHSIAFGNFVYNTLDEYMNAHIEVFEHKPQPFHGTPAQIFDKICNLWDDVYHDSRKGKICRAIKIKGVETVE